MNIIDALDTLTMKRSAFTQIEERNRFIASLLGYRHFQTTLRGPNPNASTYDVLIDPDHNCIPTEFIKDVGYRNDEYMSVEDINFSDGTPIFLFDTFAGDSKWQISHIERKGDFWFGYASAPGKFVSFDNAININYLIIALALLVLIEEYDFKKYDLLLTDFDLN